MSATVCACPVGKPALVRSALRSGPGNDRIGVSLRLTDHFSCQFSIEHGPFADVFKAIPHLFDNIITVFHQICNSLAYRDANHGFMPDRKMFSLPFDKCLCFALAFISMANSELDLPTRHPDYIRPTIEYPRWQPRSGYYN